MPRTTETTSYQQPWTPADDGVLGTDTDAKVAVLLGRTRGAVKARRFALGIAPRATRDQPAEDAPFRLRLSRRLKSARQAAGLTQADAASRAGFAVRLWERYEAGHREPMASRLAAIAKALGVSADWLLG